MRTTDLELLDTPAAIHTAASALVARAKEVGVVLTIQLEPLLPLAMGNYTMRVETREAITHNA